MLIHSYSPITLIIHSYSHVPKIFFHIGFWFLWNYDLDNWITETKDKFTTYKYQISIHSLNSYQKDCILMKKLEWEHESENKIIITRDQTNTPVNIMKTKQKTLSIKR